MTAVLFSTFVILLVLGVPIGFGLFLSSAVALVMGDVPFRLILQRAVTSADSFVLLAIPFFLIAGNLMSRGGISKRIVSFAGASVGFIPGGLAHVNVVTSMLFAGITGAAVADTSAVGSMLIPPMVKQGYDRNFTAALTAASSVIGVIIPPSIPFVLYAVVAEVSVGRMFLAGIVPGVLVGLLQMAISFGVAKRRGYGIDRTFSVAHFFRELKRGVWALLMPVIILGGIILGVVTPTEAAVLASVYALAIGLFVYGDLRLRDLPGVLSESAVTTAIVMIMIAGASLYSWIIASEQIPARLVELVSLAFVDATPVLLLFVAIYLVAGMFLDLGAAIILFVPIFLPSARLLGVDPILFGIITVLSLGIGLITPPVGSCLFIACRIADSNLIATSRSTLIFIVGFLAIILLLIFFPDLALFIPRLTMG